MLLDGCVFVYVLVVDAWSKEDCLTLLERIQSLLPDGDAMKYKTTESHFDWEKVCFGDFTGDMCKQKWAKVSTEVSQSQFQPITKAGNLFSVLNLWREECHRNCRKKMSVVSIYWQNGTMKMFTTEFPFFIYLILSSGAEV